MTQKEYYQDVPQDREKENLVKSGLGVLLRNERIKKGLDYNQIFKITRIQPYILNALEDEDWDNLPSPVLVKGFIRSYAKTIGLDDEMALTLYEDSFKFENSEPPHSLKQIKNRIWLPIAAIIAFLAVICGYYVWAGYPFRQEPDKMITAELIDDLEYIHKPGEKLSIKDNEIELVTDQNEPTSNVFEIYNNAPTLEIQYMAEDFTEEKILTADLSGAGEASASKLSLRADIIEETWVSIIIDDKDPMEYIFQPGSNHEWKANEGFELHIGNAGGISFDLNGRKIENLGKTGQVIRIALPENYKRRSPQD